MRGLKYIHSAGIIHRWTTSSVDRRHIMTRSPISQRPEAFKHGNQWRLWPEDPGLWSGATHRCRDDRVTLTITALFHFKILFEFLKEQHGQSLFLPSFVKSMCCRYVATRWYRAPEIMLNWMHYKQTGVDLSFLFLRFFTSCASRRVSIMLSSYLFIIQYWCEALKFFHLWIAFHC